MPDDDKLLIGLPAAYLKQIFQRELVSLCIGSRRFMSFTGCVRINNPTFNHEPFAELDLNWLLGQTKIRARRGSRRIYITRGKSINRKIIEDENFQKFLSQNRFETIDFGNGETSIFQQIKMLDGAGIVLSPHGANLTNIAFLEAGVSVIEVLPAPWSYASFIEIGLMARLNYACVVNNAISNKQGDMIADIDYLVQALGEALKHG
jgi:capsular polysaccharide biosynthesis protein